MGISTIARAVRGTTPKSARAYIIPLDIHQGDNILSGDMRAFQYFPETLSDSKASNYQPKVIPGLSHPLYQWTSGGAREISFEAVFTRDRALSSAERDETGMSTTGGRYINNATLTASGPQYRKQKSDNFSFASEKDLRNVDIPSAVAWLRSFMDPEYSVNGAGGVSDANKRPYPPRKMILGFRGVRINWGNASLPSSELYCIMVGCDVTYDAFFVDGTPRVARVALAFNEIIQVGGGIKVHDAFNRRNYGLRGYALGASGVAGSSYQ